MSLISTASSGFGDEVKPAERAFGADVRFLSSHVETIVLRGKEGKAQVAVVPAYQGRVMTSTATGDTGTSYGWINYDQVAAGITAGAPINVFGGEERFWLGPEGGQFAIFFAPGAEFDFANWQTPPSIDTDPFEVSQQAAGEVTCRHEAKVVNHSGTSFAYRVDRHIGLMSTGEIKESLGVDASRVSSVAYRTSNRLTNTGSNDWKKETGLLSIWTLGMYKHGPETTVVIPYRQGPESELGTVVIDDYFGKVPAERLKVSDRAIFFSGDGTYRSKIGLTPQRSTDICGSYDAARGVLTIVKYNQPGPEVTDYVNSMWEIQDEPYAGDAINSYNDGPAEPGAKPLGPFYELETSSPALALKSGASGEHIQETYHFEGNPDALDHLSKELLGVSLADINAALR
ncbi:MAG: DUF6786 family protein [Aeoliella sp.]